MNNLNEIANKLVENGKGILAADESFDTIEKRFKKINLDSTFETRNAYRKMLFSTPNLEKYISGVILFEETLNQDYIKNLSDRGILIGIKVDEGKKKMVSSLDEYETIGLQSLKERLKEYQKFGAIFTKWRAVFSISDILPTDNAISTNAILLARYAAVCQELNFMPIVEPEVLMDGDHTIEKTAIATKRVLEAVFRELINYKVDVSGILLKPNMVIQGKDCMDKKSPEEIARATIDVFREVLPDNLPGVVFLSGGESSEEAAQNLDAIVDLAKKENTPWKISFSYGRALQNPSLEAWSGKDENVLIAQEALINQAQKDSQAQMGNYDVRE